MFGELPNKFFFFKIWMDFKPDPETYPVKFIVLGDSTVGKTALINRYVHGFFGEDGINVHIFLCFTARL